MAPQIPFTLKQLRYLVAVADHRHFGHAAESCNVSQPSLSAQIAQLEHAIGTAVFDRSHRRITPTQRGQILIDRARQILSDCQALYAVSRSVAEPLSGPFRLGVIPTVGPYLLPRIMPALRDGHPHLRLYLREDLTDRLLDTILSGDLDAGIVAMPVDRPGFQVQPLFDETFFVALPPQHPLASHEAITDLDLTNEPVLLLEDGHCLRDQALAACRRTPRGPAGAAGNVDGFSATSLETLREMVAGNIGLTLLPALACQQRLENIAIRPFAPPQPFRRLALVWRRNTPRLREMEMLVQFMTDNAPSGLRPLADDTEAA
ncbi:LysR substrate-binding domain-containing protein [Fodinicurvata sp. EGI_FJ10296]|uniref:LysR substrate-binding domain-containing protein n=1 Tax=Fodinicurvata sp. EGI_FJ10296 TaxID=3231908 RepID=UPI0034559051